jgi:hypothetical protein
VLLTNISARVIVLSPSEEYANYLLTLNHLQGSIPWLEPTHSLEQYPKGKVEKYALVDPNTESCGQSVRSSFSLLMVQGSILK